MSARRETTTPGRRDAAPGGDAPETVRALRRADARRVAGVVLGLAVLTAGLMLLRVTWGTYQVTVPDLVRILGGERIAGASFIVWEEKLPRAVAAALTGAALGAAGALYRRTLRNPLASPDVLGTTAGAAAGVVLTLTASAGQAGGSSDLARAGAALLGALAAGAAVLLAARSVGGQRFVVAGVGVAAAGQAIVSGAMLSLSEHDLASATRWIAGSLNGVTWGRIGLLAAVLALALPAAGWLHRRLAPADVGDDLAHALGARPRTTAALALTVGAVLAAAATATVGPLSFVALLATPLALGLTRGRPSLPAAALTGAGIVLLADVLGTEALGLIADGAALPTGVLTGAAGAPLMLALLLRAGRSSEGTR